MPTVVTASIATNFKSELFEAEIDILFISLG
jgi:hypothetical protein